MATAADPQRSSSEKSFVPTVIVHGGAGRKRFDQARIERYERGLDAAARAGISVLEQGGSALDAAEAAVRSMESSGVFNAGKGACLTLEREIEMDAAVMVGADRSSGACGAVPGVLHAVTLARRIMEQTDHLILAGEGARRFAESFGVEMLSEGPSAARLKDYEKIREKRAGTPKGDRLARLELGLRHGAERASAPEIGQGDTVGAVAIDAQGKIAATVSTGGLWLKLPGRVGDSAVVGAGLDADDEAGGAVATGIGEAILRVELSRGAVQWMREGCSAQEACERACADLKARLGPDTAGLIAIDRTGRVGAAMNTEAMGRAVLRLGETEPWVAVQREDGPPPA